MRPPCRRCSAIEQTARRSEAGLVVAALALFFTIGACRRGADVLPPAVQGTWTTSSPAYSDRYLRLADRTVEFGLGGNDAEIHSIRLVDAEDMEDGTALYTVHYRSDEGDTLSLRFLYRPGNPPTLKLDHQEAIWARSKARIPGGGLMP